MKRSILLGVSAGLMLAFASSSGATPYLPGGDPSLHFADIPLLDPLGLTKFQDEMYNPVSNIAVPDGVYNGLPLYDINIAQFQWKFSNQGALANGTTVWGYGCVQPDGSIKYSVPSATFVQQSGVPIAVRYTNNLVDPLTGNALSHILPVDPTLIAMGSMGGMVTGNLIENPTVVHLHGGHNPGIYDGNPWQEFGSDPGMGPYGISPSGIPGPIGNSVIYQYANNQPAALIWYHDHATGFTHLNPYAGMAGGYLIKDANDVAQNMPSGAYETALVLQDKMFQANGQLFYYRGPGDQVHPGTGNPLEGLPTDFPGRTSVTTEFFGNVNLVNGTVWPCMTTEPRKYRFHLLNGANARTYVLALYDQNNQPIEFYQVGTDGGLLPTTVVQTSLVMQPGERTDIIVDFSKVPFGSHVIMKNFGPDMMYGDPTLPAADPNTTGQVMDFCVTKPLSGPDTSVVPFHPNTVPRLNPANANVTRQITLKESDQIDPWGRLMVQLNYKSFMQGVMNPSEVVHLGDTEVWQWVNLTPDTHPMHLHDVEFQVLGRQKLMVDNVTGKTLPIADNTAAYLPPEPNEMGWKDTIQTPTGYRTDIIMQFLDVTGDYVYHCHILEHEEFDMMQPFIVVADPVPEPATLLLLGTGAVGALGWIRRRGLK